MNLPSVVEIIAVVFSSLSVWLAVKDHNLNWPVGIIGTIAFGVVFWKAKLFSSFILQLVFLAQSVYGWWYWSQPRHETPIRKADNVKLSFVLMLTFSVAMAIGSLAVFTGTVYPHLDAMIMVFSVLALHLLSARWIDNWYIWLFVNGVSFIVYSFTGLYFTALLSLVYSIMNIKGIKEWKAKCLSQA
jgi:nicotinamide mononucleotide transporter